MKKIIIWINVFILLFVYGCKSKDSSEINSNKQDCDHEYSEWSINWNPDDRPVVWGYKN